MAGWANIYDLVREEIIQRREEGCDTRGFMERLKRGEPPQEIYRALCALEVSADFPYDEPDGEDEIAALSDIAALTDYAQKSAAGIPPDKFEGAWLGRCAGCALGKPVEAVCYMFGTEGAPGYVNVRRWFEGADAWPISGYTPGTSRAKDEYGLYVGCPASQRENIAFMETDDDIRYTVTGLIMTEWRGADFTTADVGELWLSRLPYYMMCTAERQAYLNYAAFSDEPPEERLRLARMLYNPYREWIGAQIRIDAYAYAAAGDPALAARMAYRDASLSHVKNGVYGAMFWAAAIAAAFVERDAERCIEAGLAVIPRTSRLYEAVRGAVGMAHSTRGGDVGELYRALYGAYGGYSGVHTINNSALCAAALVRGGGDFEAAIAAAVGGGWDTDCNGATVGSLMGAIYGAKALPEKWTQPLHDTLNSGIPDFHPASIRDCARRSYEVYKRIKSAAN